MCEGRTPSTLPSGPLNPAIAVMPVLMAAALSAASAFAYGSTVFGSLDDVALSEYADELLGRAEEAWKWAEQNPDVTFFNNEQEQGTEGLGAGQQEVDDYGRMSKRVSASAYLFEATGASEYRDYFDQNYAEIHLMEQAYAYPFEAEQQDALLHYASLPDVTPDVAAAIRDTYSAAMDEGQNFSAIRDAIDPYRAPLKDYVWGSNSTKAHQGSMYANLSVHQLTPDRAGARPGRGYSSSITFRPSRQER